MWNCLQTTLECDTCKEVYIGESERSFGERLDEHYKSVQLENCKSAMGQHQWQSGHRIHDMNPSIVDMDIRNPHRKIKEAIHIRLNESKLNRNEGYDLPDIFLPRLREEAGGGQQSSVS